MSYFAHDRLDAYRIALDLADDAMAIARSLPRGECGEAAAAIALVERLGMADGERAGHALGSADRVNAMLTGLMKRFS